MLSCSLRKQHALVAQRIEHLTTDQKVGGSSPSKRTLKYREETQSEHNQPYTARDPRMQPLQLDLTAEDRVLVLGSSGWFGSTAVEIAQEKKAAIMVRTSSGSRTLGPHTELEAVRDFQSCMMFEPSIVIDCAFATRHKITSYGPREYMRINGELMNQALELQKLASVRRFIGISSGAALPFLRDDGLDPALDLYGYQKAQYEKMLKSPQSRNKRNTVLLRPWSMSGRHCKTPGIYALFDFISQSKGDRVLIKSPTRVYRRYTDVDDLLRMGLIAPIGEEVIESGGELVELADLARLVVETLGSPAIVERDPLTNGVDSYHSDNEIWSSITQSVGFQPKSLTEQIKVSASV